MTDPTPQTSRQQIIEREFLTYRAKVLDIAAHLDRLDRAAEPGADDYRIAAIRQAISLLIDGQTDRAKRVLELWSDPTHQPIASAPSKGASGAYEADPPAEPEA